MIKFKPKYDSFRRGMMAIDDVVEHEINDAGSRTERGELESLRAELDMARKILGLVARFGTDEQQSQLVAALGGYEEIRS